MLANDVVVVMCATICMVLLYFRLGQRSAKGSLPPSPPGIPFFGNLRQFDALRPHPQFLKWAREYGSIFSVKMGPQHMIVINTAEAAHELFVNRSKIYSGRPPSHVALDLVSDGQRMVLTPYNEQWKVARRTVQGVLGPVPTKRLRKMQEFESRVVLRDLISHGEESITGSYMQGPDDEVPHGHWFAVIRRYTTSVVLHMAYGQRAHRILNNTKLHKIYHVMANFTRVAQPGNYLADILRPLRWLPDILAPWRVEARKMHEWEMELWGSFLTETRADAQKGIARTGLVPSYLRARAEAGLEDLPGRGVIPDKNGTPWMRDKMLAYTAASLLEAGSDTSATTMHAFVLFMLLNPSALERAREEIDRVVGTERMPDWEDEQRLPWLVACIKETLRRRPPAIMGVPHRVDEDDVYNGYFIPKGSTVIGNVWAIHMDPERYPDPGAYKPERFYNPDKTYSWASGPDTNNRDHFAFGWGRRFCQGGPLSEASLFIVLSRLVWGIDFWAPINQDTGKLALPDVDDEQGTWSTGLISTPRIFPVGFKARSEKHARLIQTSFEEVQGEWQILGLTGDEQ